MTKRESLIKIAKRTQHSYEMCERIVDLFFDSICESIKDGEKFVIRGFGTFEPKNTRATNRFDPNTGIVSFSPSVKSVKYTISRSFKNDINGVEEK